MTNPYDPNQGSGGWQGQGGFGQQGPGDGQQWPGGQQPGAGAPGPGQQGPGQQGPGQQGPGQQGPGYQAPGWQGYGQQPEPTQALGWPPGQPAQPDPAPTGQFGWQPQGQWSPSGPGGPPPRNRTTLWVSLGLAAVLVAAGIVTWLVLANKDDTVAGGGENPSTSVTVQTSGPASDDTQTSDPETSGTETSDTETTDTSESDISDSETTDTSESDTSDSDTTDASGEILVEVGDCVYIKDSDRVDLNKSGIACSDPTAVYRITVIGTSKSQCDANEANWPGATGALKGKTLCLLPNMIKGECFRTAGAANGDYEKISCDKATSKDQEVVYSSITTADKAKCPTGSKPYEFPKRHALLCFAQAG